MVNRGRMANPDGGAGAGDEVITEHGDPCETHRHQRRGQYVSAGRAPPALGSWTHRPPPSNCTPGPCGGWPGSPPSSRRPEAAGRWATTGASPERWSSTHRRWIPSTKRDHHLHGSDFFEVDTYPTFTYAATGARSTPGNQVVVTGTLTVHGERRPLDVPVIISEAGPNRVLVTAEVEIDRSEWGLTS